MDNHSDTSPTKRETSHQVDRQKQAQDIATDIMIHDVRNPLSSIVSIVDMLNERDLSYEDNVWLARIKTLGHRALDILKATSGYAEMERGDYEAEQTDFNLLDVIRTTIDKVSVLSESKSLTTQVRLNGDHPGNRQLYITGDQFFIEQMLNNLLTNALEASPEKKTVTVSIATGDKLQIDVHNEGVIPEKKRDEIFDKLASYQQERGRGLGAYVAKLIAEQHGGTIDFTTGKAEGTTFRVGLPVLKSDNS